MTSSYRLGDLVLLKLNQNETNAILRDYPELNILIKLIIILIIRLI